MTDSDNGRKNGGRGMKELDRPGVFRVVSKHDLIIPVEHYQRGGSDAKVTRIANNFSWAAFQVLSVTDVGGGNYHVIEGGHRTRAAMKRPDVDMVPCMVFEMETIQDEALAFLEVNVNRKPMSAVDRHHAYIVSGDPLAVKVENAVRESGRRIEAGQGAHSISCVTELRRCIHDDEPAFYRVWPVISRLCEGRKITRDIVLGLFWLERNVEGGVSGPARSRRIYDVGFDRLFEGAVQGRAYHANNHPKSLADGMLKHINHKLRNKWVVA